MPLRQLFLAVAILLLLAPELPPVKAQQLRPRRVENANRPRRATVSGIITDRLSSKGLQRWKAIERLALAADAQGRMLHPTLAGLWQWAQQSGHAIYIEFPNPSRISTCTAGSFSIESFDLRGENHAAVIRLHLSNIDQAYIGPAATRPDGFTPFEGLAKEERYAEVLGHELAHAAWILSDLKRSQMVEEVVEQTNELLLSSHTWRTGEPMGQALRQRLNERDSLLKDLEAQAEETEVTIWQELVASQRARGKNPGPGKKAAALQATMAVK